MEPRHCDRRTSASSSERIIFYVDDFSSDPCHDIEFRYRPDSEDYVLCPSNVQEYRQDDASCPASSDNVGLRLDERSILFSVGGNEQSSRRPSTNSTRGFASRPTSRQQGLEIDRRSTGRRSSTHSARSRTSSTGRPTPLGDGRRASVGKKPKSRGGSSTRRKDSVKPARNEVKAAQKAIQDAREIEQARRHKRIAMIVLGTFLFLLTASILVVVVTLTNSSFLSPATGSKELTRHRAQLRKENEELLNSLNRDISLPGNSTAPP